MDDLQAAFNRRQLEDQIYDVSDWIIDFRNQKKSLRRRIRKNLMAQDILSSTIIRAHAAFNRLLLKDQIYHVSDWVINLRDKKKSLRRSRRKNLRVQAILNSTLIEAEALLRVKLQRHQVLQRTRLEVSKSGCNNMCNATSTDKLSNQWDEKTCEDVNNLNRFMCVLNEVKNSVQS
jgi:hypothetical protein